MSAAFMPPDQAHRDRALDPGLSFIVQAPAGSGKTELLIQRYLRLLACVDEPEEVLAVTFTRKAAGEVRNRVIAAILQAQGGAAPTEPHLLRSYELGRAILNDPRRREWQLHRHPSRLGISTIDSVNAWLAGRAPLSAGGSALQAVTDSPEALYQEAAWAVLGLLADGSVASDSIAALLGHLDNDAARFVRLIVAMLPRRDQWLRHVVGAAGEREAMEKPLRELTEHGLHETAACIDGTLAAELAQLLCYAGQQLLDADRDSPVSRWAGRTGFPAPEAAELPLWQALAEALLTRDGQWRKAINIQHGFPPKTAEKQRMERLLAACADRADLRDRLLDVRILPGGEYADGQWQILHALLDVLRHAAAELRLVFASRGQTDFPAVAADALHALGADTEPSELGLSLDYRIRHILVDEFQDTSLAQFDLLRQLIAGWEPGDGRTIFLVGDPMQSIYRFREAEVGLFMRVRDEGIGDMRPESLRLRANFRSEPEIVEWTNGTFARTFPAADDPHLGAVRFAASVAARPVRTGAGQPVAAGVSIHWLPAGDEHIEARRVVEIITDARAKRAEERVCVLVRSRGHASRIIKALRTAEILFVAPDIERMERASVAQDLLALTRALGHPADRLAWIGVLRAPVCGLSLADLQALLGIEHERPVPDILRDAGRRKLVSDAGTAAVDRLVRVFDRASAARGRRSLRDLVEGAWLDLGGPATTREDAELETADAFFHLLEGADAGGDCPDPVWLGQQMGRRTGSLGSGEPGVQLLTMHKAKGLEFDTVILPGLGNTPRGSEPALLLWHGGPGGSTGDVPVLAPMAPSGTDGDPLYRYLTQLEQRKRRFEIDRLLYVACTRAKAHLHLLARVEADHDPRTGEIVVRKPKSGSLLERLWPAVAAEALAQAGQLPLAVRGDVDSTGWVQPLIRRLPPGWVEPRAPSALLMPGAERVADSSGPLEYDWASSWARHVGSVVHLWLQIIAQQGVDGFDADRIRRLEPEFRRMLEQRGTEPRDLDKAIQRVRNALTATLGDPQGRWILSSEHREARSELALTVCDGELFRQFVVDRTFIAADGCRWVIDYKTSAHEGGDAEAFLRVEAERHRGQLRHYRDALAELGIEPIRTALYFPLLAAFHEVAVDADPQAG